MSTNQELRQVSIRAVTSTTGTLPEDWIALFDARSIPAGTYNERMIGYLQGELVSTVTNLPELMDLFAVNQGFDRWESMGTFTP
jgi:hypothetical protein